MSLSTKIYRDFLRRKERFGDHRKGKSAMDRPVHGVTKTHYSVHSVLGTDSEGEKTFAMTENELEYHVDEI